MRTLLFVGAVLIFTVTSARADVPPTCKLVPANGSITATFAPSTSMTELAVWLYSFTCKSVVFSETVAAIAPKITIIGSNKLTPTNAIALFVYAAQAAGVVVAQNADAFVLTLDHHDVNQSPLQSACLARERQRVEQLKKELEKLATELK